jgi:hypothetical protein
MHEASQASIVPIKITMPSPFNKIHIGFSLNWDFSEKPLTLSHNKNYFPLPSHLIFIQHFVGLLLGHNSTHQVTHWNCVPTFLELLVLYPL